MEKNKPASSKNLPRRYIASHHSPASDIHQDDQLDIIQSREQWSEEETEPDHSLVIDYVKHIFSYFELSIFWLKGTEWNQKELSLTKVVSISQHHQDAQ